MSHQDVDGDGRPDLLFTVRADRLHLTSADREAVVVGTTFAGEPFRDADWVTVR